MMTDALLRTDQPMHETMTKPDTSKSAVGYTSNTEHLSDCLRWLDLLIHRQLLLQGQRRPANPLETFKGLVISDEEIAQLLTVELEKRVSMPDIETSDQILMELANTIRQRREKSIEEGVPLALPELTEIFSLDDFEENCLLIALAPELSTKYQKFYAYLHDDVTRKKPSVDLALLLLCPTADMKLERRRAFELQRPLMRYRLIELVDDSPDARSPLLTQALKLDDRIVRHLISNVRLDPRIERVASLINADVEWGDLSVNAAVQDRIRNFVEWHSAERDAENVIFYIHGPEGCGARYLAKCISHQLGLPLLLGDAVKMLSRPLPFEELMWLLGREASLQPAVLGLDHLDALDANGASAQFEAVLESARVFSRVSFLFGQRPWPRRVAGEEVIYIEVPLAVPDAGRREHLWASRLAGATSIASEVDAGALASKFRLSPGQIDQCFSDATASEVKALNKVQAQLATLCVK
jgi:hypothetical protein